MIIYMRDITANLDIGTPTAKASSDPDDRGRRTVALLAYDGLTMFEFGVANEVFGYDRSEMFGVPWYRFFVCAPARTITVDGGLRLQVQHGLARLSGVDTIVVPPTAYPDRVPAAVLDALRKAHQRGARLVSLCTGAFVLAAAGLLDDRRATTHWSETDELARRYPRVRVDPGVLYIDDGDILTSAGSAASIDLCLHLVRLDFGVAIASRLARRMVVPPYRDGGQAQYIDTPIPDLDASDPFTETMGWLQQHLGEPVTIADLAARAAMSRRTFARRFLGTTGTTPYQWLVRQRLQLAQRLLETSDLPIDLVAEKSGFVTAANLRKHFGRVVRVSPQAYRRTFKCPEEEPMGVTA
jgi:AraC family transcriptional regulator, transcriptional activator FtrA